LRSGRSLIAQEADLDQPFASKTITEHAVAASIQAIAGTQAALRTAHLKCHLATLGVPTPAQTKHYPEQRGYAGARAQRISTTAVGPDRFPACASLIWSDRPGLPPSRLDGWIIPPKAKPSRATTMTCRTNSTFPAALPTYLEADVQDYLAALAAKGYRTLRSCERAVEGRTSPFSNRKSERRNARQMLTYSLR
jgi:hypothetical protein